MIVNVVPKEAVPAIWDKVAPFLADGLEYAQGECTLEHLQVYLSEGSWMLLVYNEGAEVRGASVVQFFNRPAQRIAYIVVAGGYLCTTKDTFEQMRAIFKKFGATHIEGAARESAARLWRRVGLKEKYRIVGAKL